MSLISEAALTDAMIKEFSSGRALMEARQNVREQAAAEAAQSYKGHKTVKGLGKHICEIPQHEYLILIEKYGFETVHSRDFLRTFQRLEPSMASNKI